MPFCRCIRIWALNASHMTFYGRWDHIWSAFLAQTIYKMGNLFCSYEFTYLENVLNMNMNMNVNMKMKTNKSITNAETVNYKNEVWLILLLQPISCEFFKKKFTYSTSNSSFFSHDGNICFRSFVHIYMYFSTTLCSHSNRIQAIFVYMFIALKITGEIDEYICVGSIDKTRCSHSRMSIVVFISRTRETHKIFQCFHRNDLWQPPNCVIKITEMSFTVLC